jgi:hypothetical protein
MKNVKINNIKQCYSNFVEPTILHTFNFTNLYSNCHFFNCTSNKSFSNSKFERAKFMPWFVQSCNEASLLLSKYGLQYSYFIFQQIVDIP